MGSVTRDHQVDLETAMAKRNETFGVHHSHKAEARKEIPEPDTHPSKIQTPDRGLCVCWSLNCADKTTPDANPWWKGSA